MTTAVIFDFDGTIALGDGPVRAYAREVERRAGVTGVQATLETATVPVLDGYDAVRVAAEALNVSEQTLSASYLASRDLLATDEAEIHAPAGLDALLAELGEQSIVRILVTNAPSIRIDEALTALGLHGAFDRIITSAGKPHGFESILDALHDEGIDRILSVGDVWHNDLAPAQQRGHATALVGPFTDAAAAPMFRGASLTELLPALRAWAATTSS